MGGTTGLIFVVATGVANRDFGRTKRGTLSICNKCKDQQKCGESAPNVHFFYDNAKSLSLSLSPQMFPATLQDA